MLTTTRPPTHAPTTGCNFSVASLRAIDPRAARKITVDETTGCWLWVGALSGGYATVTRDKRSLKAHRYIYELLAGPIPFGLHIDHLCRVPRCVNPGHLEPVSAAENNRRAHVTEQCHKGHPWTIENTYTYLWRGCFKRICRGCKREYIAEYRARKAAS